MLLNVLFGVNYLSWVRLDLITNPSNHESFLTAYNHANNFFSFYKHGFLSKNFKHTQTGINQKKFKNVC